MSGEKKYVSISAIKPLMRHLEDILLQEKEEESELTKNIWNQSTVIHPYKTF